MLVNHTQLFQCDAWPSKMFLDSQVAAVPGRMQNKKAMTLRLFDRLDDDNYYRAFPLVERRD